MAEKFIIYSSAFGGYDQILPVAKPDPLVEYLMFTDQPGPLPAPWQAAPMAGTQGDLSPRQLSRLPKLAPHRYLPDHDVSIYVDANIAMTGKSMVNLAFWELRYANFAAPPHVKRRGEMSKHAHNCLYAEASVCDELGLDYPDRIQEQMERYRAKGFPRRIGLLENCLVIRRNTELIQKLNNLWLEEYLLGSQRDQLSLMYCLWNLGIPWRAIPIHARSNIYYQQRPHLKERNICPPKSGTCAAAGNINRGSEI